MKSAIATVAVVGSVAALALMGQKSSVSLAQVNTPFSEEEREFISFIAKHRKNYFSKEEYNYRLDIFAEHYRAIQAHNADSTQTFKMGVNEFSDLTPYEFKKYYTGLDTAAIQRDPEVETHEYVEGEYLASSVDWRNKGAVTGVKNQGRCGSCWAFSTTGAVEGAWKLAGHSLTSLSEQELVDCDHGDGGCNGGLMQRAFSFVSKSGLCSESAYRYTGRDGSCKRSCSSVAKIHSYRNVGHSANSLKSAINKQPVSVSIEADQKVFQSYKSGVITSGCGSSLDHGVLAVGYGSDYVLVKNSWGTSWGDRGYVKIAFNQCGITRDASYPVV